MTKIALFQYQIENLPFNKYEEKIKNLVNQAKNADTQILLFPEYAGIEIGGYHHTDEELFAELQQHIPQYCKFFQTLAHQNQLYIQPGTIPIKNDKGKYFNRAYFFGPNGQFGYQDKLQLTEFEKHTSLFEGGQNQTVFETTYGKIAIAICYDSEFPEIVRRLAFSGAELILVPSYTTTVAGYYRVFLSARARALENQCYVAATFMVGPVSLSNPTENTVGQAAICGPIEMNFSDDGLIAQGNMNKPKMIIGSLSFEKIAEIRKNGDVHNFEDAKKYTHHNDLLIMKI